MHRPGRDRFDESMELGATSSVAAQVLSDLHRCAAEYGDLFGTREIGTTLLSTLAFANAYAAPGIDVRPVIVTARAGLWNFGLDSHIDRSTTSIREVRRIAEDVLAAAAGQPLSTADPAARLLIHIRMELARAPAFTSLQGVWTGEVQRMVTAMVRESEWRYPVENSGPPALADYLNTASDSIGFGMVLVSHWIGIAETPEPGPTEIVVSGIRPVERLLRLLNDLATVDRDVATGDLNALTLGASRADLAADVERMIVRRYELLAPFHDVDPRLAEFVARQIGFNIGFYQRTDYRDRA